MKKKGELASPSESRAWTRVDDYVVALARHRAERRKREPRPRTQPEAPRLLLSTVPFLMLFAALAVITVGIVILAWPGAHSAPRAQHPAPQELGYAAKGWFQEAKKEFR